ncbi:MAG: hypothetical protein HC881_16450 [Leptolyngbyaceae cyanobacterium SL_7_1]|nr:hypothetical protein [Leptolyngbyaceae cyanobacterium SL_7_1]
MDGVAASLRIYAATMPLTGLLVAFGVKALVPGHLQPTHLSDRSPILWISASILVGLTIAAPIATKALSHPPQLLPVPCADSLAYVQFHPRSVVNLQPDEAIAHTHLPQVRISDFRRSLDPIVRSLVQRQSTITDQIRTLRWATPGQTVLHALDFQDQSQRWIVVETKALPEKPAIVALCGRLQNEVLFAQSTKSF